MVHTLAVIAQAALESEVIESTGIGINAKLGLVLGAVCAGCGIWGVLNIGDMGLERWKSKFLADTEMEMEELLVQIPAAQIVNYSMIIGLILGAVTFMLIAPGQEGFNWKAGLFFGLAVMIGVQVLAKQFVKFLKAHRLNKFNDQLEEVLMSMGNALKAGFSVNQAVEMVIKQGKNPISLEFKLMIQQTQLGVTFDDALRNMATRVGSEDFKLVSSAIITARSTGGDLTGVFARLADVIRERLRIQRRIRTLTAQGRLQGVVLSLLPLAMIAILYFFVDADLVRNFFGHPIGIAALVVVVILQTCAFLTIRKITNIDI
ncbi:hypothetical protein BVY04_03425 [bacterium M21]|nr:hypothetical protein BVY04_03425 [bacterium M21]